MSVEAVGYENETQEVTAEIGTESLAHVQTAGYNPFEYIRSFFYPKPPLPVFDQAQESALLTQLSASVASDKYSALYALRIVKAFEEAVRKIDEMTGVTVQDRYQKKVQAAASAQLKLGTLVYCHEVDPANTKAITRGTNPVVDLKNLRIQLMSQAGAQIKAEGYLYRAIGLHNSEMVQNRAFAYLIADLLLDPQGQLQIGMIPIIKKQYVPTNNPTEWQTYLGTILDQMGPSWQAALDQINAPTPNNTFGTDLIRAELSLFPNTSISDVHARRVALAALLAPRIDEDSSNSPVIAWEKKIWNNHPLKALADFGSLIENGYLVRNNRPYFYEEALPTFDLQRSLFIGVEGKIQGTKIALWNYPVIRAACKQMGIENPEIYVEEVLATLGRRTVMIEEVVAAYAKAICPIEGQEQQALIAKGKMGAITESNRLLLVAESALRSLANVAQPTDTCNKVTQCANKRF